LDLIEKLALDAESELDEIGDEAMKECNEKPLKVCGSSRGNKKGVHYHRHASNVDNAKVTLSQFRKISNFTGNRIWYKKGLGRISGRLHLLAQNQVTTQAVKAIYSQEGY